MRPRAPRATPWGLVGLGVLWACGSVPWPEPPAPPDTQPPAVHLLSPRPGQVVAALQVQVRGALEDDRGVVSASWSLNGAPPVALPPTDTFAFTGAARLGDNLLHVEALDEAGNRGVAEVGFHVGSALAGGLSHSAAVRSGRLFTWGDNGSGQLGLSGTDGSSQPMVVPGLEDVRTVVAGPSATLALVGEGSAWAWGALPQGLVPASGDRPEVPARVEVPGPVVDAALGMSHALLLLADGTVFAVGSNTAGQLGLGSTADVAAPTRVPGLSRIIRVAAGSEHSVALREDGAVFVWGSNSDGQLGTGGVDDTPHPEPLQVAHLGRAVDVAAGRGHVVVVQDDGHVRAWGLGSSGQLGQGQSGLLGSRSQPVEVLDLTDAVAVYASNNFSLALGASGSLWAWGQNSNGQLGDGSLAGRPRAVGVQGLGPVLGVGAGSLHSLALTDAGTFAWGNNASGQLGAAVPARASLPLQVAFP